MTDPTISVQLYTVKEALSKDLDGTLARLKEIGFSTVEAYDFVSRADELAAAFARHGLTAATGHAALASETIGFPDGSVVAAPTHDEVFTAAKKLGITTVIDPYTPPSRWESLAEIEATARNLNAAAAAAAAYGITVGYHNHHQEFTKIDGRFGLEIFAELLDESVVLEVDLYWATIGGADLPGLLERLGSRIIAVHVKDGTLEPEKANSFPPADQVPAGQGKVPLAASLDAIPSLRYAVVEFDFYPGDILDAVAQSYAYLTARGLA